MVGASVTRFPECVDLFGRVTTSETRNVPGHTWVVRANSGAGDTPSVPVLSIRGKFLLYELRVFRLLPTRTLLSSSCPHPQRVESQAVEWVHGRRGGYEP